ncbi:ArsR/SmtB family transcription factor [Paludibacterium paludis]|uniref:Transcriptional regulator n=1 Tax=Paludibacterium paludis TaxID=1225769 RepID=A0A918P486_9NEIS|nr:metalloregulator ArsR/SmtB family transcription factor [Paludibacterium paludis]GGY20082.1 transcriptional regulator [Paludibacterium paludis]
MKIFDAAERLAALGHESRLAIFRMLVEAGPEGLHASAMSDSLALPPATLSFHLSHLSRAGLIAGRRQGRFIHYAVKFGTMDELLAFLTRDCCRGHPCLPKTCRCDDASPDTGKETR